MDHTKALFRRGMVCDCRAFLRQFLGNFREAGSGDIIDDFPVDLG